MKFLYENFLQLYLLALTSIIQHFNKVEDYFKDEKNKTNNQYNGFNLSYNSTFKNKNQIDTAFTKSLEYTKEFKEKNMSLNEIIIKFKNEIPRFKTVYDRAQRDFFKNNQTAIKNINNKNNKNLLKNSIKNIKNSDEDKMKIEALEFWNKLNDFKVGFITTAAISAILAAGLWAASAFDFGISIPPLSCCSNNYCSNLYGSCRSNKYLYNN